MACGSSCGAGGGEGEGEGEGAEAVACDAAPPTASFDAGRLVSAADSGDDDNDPPAKDASAVSVLAGTDAAACK